MTIATAAIDRATQACRVAGTTRPRPEADIRFELWLPPAAGWSGRYYQMGNGGFAGTISSETLADAARRGDAAAAADTGHRGNGFDARWATNRPDLVADYGYRAIKATADAAHALIAAYYARPAAHRYYMGCSNGGRQALVAASRWPADWDGIIAGAPAADWSYQLERFAAVQKALRMDPGGWIDADALAGGAAALTPRQAQSLRAIEAAGYPLAQASLAEWRQWIVNPDRTAQSQLTFADEAFRHLLRDDPTWTVERYDPVRDAPDAAVRDALDVGSLRAFVARGGKILSYFGWADAVIAPLAGLRFHAAQVADLGGRAKARAGYRLFMVPGMAHCQGGAEPHAFGQALVAPALRDDRRHDIRRAIEAWVETGLAPATLTAQTLSGKTLRTLRPE